MDTQEAFVQSLADDAVSIDGTDYLPVGKPNSYKDYELIYYINDVTIDYEEVLVEYGAAGTATGTYEYGLQRLSVEHVNEAKEYYLYNGTGNVTQTTAENGSMFLRYTYDAFGNASSIRAPMTVDIDDLNRYTYNGEDYDYNTGLQYLRARYYSTGTGNFISQDTYLGDLLNPLSQNRYTYAHNSPVMYDDPSGHEVDWEEALETIGKILFWPILSLTGCSSDESNEEITSNSSTSVSGAISEAEDNMNSDSCNEEYGEMGKMKASANGVSLIADYESFSAKPYKDSKGNLTIGYGHLILDGEYFGEISEEEGKKILAEDLAGAEQLVNNYAVQYSMDLTQNEFDALVSVAFNSGNGVKYVMTDILSGIDPVDAFTRYYTRDKAIAALSSNDKTDLGLWRRRMDEADVYLHGDYIRQERNPKE